MVSISWNVWDTTGPQRFTLYRDLFKTFDLECIFSDSYT
jgi:hypothetical protein